MIFCARATRGLMVEVLSYKDAGGKAKKRAGRVRLEVAHHVDKETIRIFLDKNLKSGSKVHTDGWRGYTETALLDYRHIVKVQNSPQSASRLAPHIHRVFSNLKNLAPGNPPRRCAKISTRLPGRVRFSLQPTGDSDGGVPNVAWHQLHQRPSIYEGITLSGNNRISI